MLNYSYLDVYKPDKHKKYANRLVNCNQLGCLSVSILFKYLNKRVVTFIKCHILPIVLKMELRVKGEHLPVQSFVYHKIAWYLLHYEPYKCQHRKPLDLLF